MGYGIYLIPVKELTFLYASASASESFGCVLHLEIMHLK